MKKIIVRLIFSMTFLLNQISYAQNILPTDIFTKTNSSLISWQEIIEHHWQKIDVDKNNLLDRMEFHTVSTAFVVFAYEFFDKLDTNQDYFISKEELSHFSQEQLKQQKQSINSQWTILDKNNDYKISFQEAQPSIDITLNFSSLDTNLDNFIEIYEFINFHNKVVSTKFDLPNK